MRIKLDNMEVENLSDLELYKIFNKLKSKKLNNPNDYSENDRKLYEYIYNRIYTDYPDCKLNYVRIGGKPAFWHSQ